MSTRTLSVPEIHCQTCKDAIEGALTRLKGVRQAVADVAARRVRIEFDESSLSPARLVEVIEKQGFSVGGDETGRS